MLREFSELALRLLTVTRDIRDNKTAISKLEQQVRELSDSVKELAYELRQLRDNEVHEREKLALRLENALLRIERRTLLSAGSPEDVGLLSSHNEAGASPDARARE